jgi:hypothetical protein
MDKHRFRSYLDDGLFVVLIMVAAIASAAMEASAVLGAMSKAEATRAAKSAPAATAPVTAQAQPSGASSVEGDVVSAAAPRAAFTAAR